MDVPAGGSTRATTLKVTRDDSYVTAMMLCKARGFSSRAAGRGGIADWILKPKDRSAGTGF